MQCADWKNKQLRFEPADDSNISTFGFDVKSKGIIVWNMMMTVIFFEKYFDDENSNCYEWISDFEVGQSFKLQLMLRKSEKKNMITENYYFDDAHDFVE